MQVSVQTVICRINLSPFKKLSIRFFYFADFGNIVFQHLIPLFKPSEALLCLPCPERSWVFQGLSVKPSVLFHILNMGARAYIFWRIKHIHTSTSIFL